jgi:hypothetical protein
MRLHIFLAGGFEIRLYANRLGDAEIDWMWESTKNLVERVEGSRG